MWDAAGNREDVPFAERAGRAALDAVAANLAAGDDRRCPVDDAQDVDLALVELRRAGGVPSAGVDLVALRLEQQPARLELPDELVSCEEDRAIGAPVGRREGVGPDRRKLLVLVRRGSSAYADRADDLPFVEDRHPALE